MIHIDIRGPLACARSVGRQRFTEHATQGRHVVLEAPGDLSTNLPERRLSSADVLITVRAGDGPVSETTTLPTP